MRPGNDGIALQRQMEAILAPYRQKGETRRALWMLAEIFQSELTMHPSYRKGEVIPHSEPLEMIMRVVTAVLDGMEGADRPGNYISAKLRYGVRRLAEHLEEETPSFREVEDQKEKERKPRLTSV